MTILKLVAPLSMIGIALLGCAGNVQASLINDANLTSPGGSTPGWYDGSGNPNGGFTVDSENGVELGLRAKLRQSPGVIASATNVYNVPAGPQTGSPSHAAWNYEFSIDLQPGGSGGSGLTLSQITASLTITDLTTGQHATINPLTYWSDDSGYGSSGKTTPESASEWGVQNSENPQFSDFPLAFEYNMNTGTEYEFDLTVDQGTNQLATDTIFVNVAPEPATFALMGSGLLLAGAFSKLRKRKS